MIITSKENIFLSACGKVVSSEIDTKTTESNQEFREDNNIVKRQPENEEIVDAVDYITENYAIEFDEAEMILTGIPEDCFLSKYGDIQDVIRKKWVIIL